MKQIFLFFTLLISISGYSQDRPVRTDLLRNDGYNTTEMNAIPSPREGDEIYNNITKTKWIYDGTVWMDSGSGGGTTDAADLTSGVLADARVQSSNVTQHEANLTITESQISDLNHTVNTDNQTISISGNIITLEDGTNTIDLNPYLDNVNNYVDAITVVGTTTKTITLIRSGLPDLTADFTDLSGAGGDGNDFLTAVTESGGILTFNITGQTNPTFDLDTFLASKGYLTSASDIVDRTTAQSVSGSKTFTDGTVFTSSISANGGVFLDVDDNGGGILWFPSNDLAIGNGNFQLKLFGHQGKLALRNATQASNGGALLIEQNNTAIRSVLFPDKDGTVAFLDDIAGGGSPVSTTFATAGSVGYIERLGIKDPIQGNLWGIFGRGTASQDLIISKDNDTDLTNGVTPIQYTLNGTGTPTNAQDLTDKEYVDAAISGGGNLTTEQGNRIANENKFKDFLKTANGNITSEDIESTTANDEGLKGIVSNLDQIIELDLEDSDIPLGASLIVQNDGALANTTVKFASGQTGNFTGSGGAGDQIQLTGFGEFVVLHKRSGFYRVTGDGTIGNQVTAVYQGNNALDPVNNQDNVNGVDTNSEWAAASIPDPDNVGKFLLELTRTKPTGTAATAWVTLDGNGVQYSTTYSSFSVDAQEITGTAFDVGMLIGDGFNEVDTRATDGTMSTETFTNKTTNASGNLRIRIRSFGGGQVNDVIRLKNVIFNE